jgi:hypothetical protein
MTLRYYGCACHDSHGNADAPDRIEERLTLGLCPRDFIHAIAGPQQIP